MLEKDMEELIANYPNDFFPDYNLELLDRQGILDNTARFDLLFSDSFGNTILMELKAKKASVDNIDQLITYQDKLIRKNKINAKMWLVALNIPNALQKRLKDNDIKFFEIEKDKFERVAKKKNYILKIRKVNSSKNVRSKSYKKDQNLNVTVLKNIDSENIPKNLKLINELYNMIILKPQWLNNLSYKRKLCIDRAERYPRPDKYFIYRIINSWRNGSKLVELHIGIFDKGYFFSNNFTNDGLVMSVYLKNGTLNKDDYAKFVFKIKKLGYYQYVDKSVYPMLYKEWFMKTYDSTKVNNKLEVNSLFEFISTEISNLGNIFLEYF